MKLNSKMPYIDYLIIMCDIVRVKVKINNHNLGNIHNMYITEFIITYTKIFKRPKVSFNNKWLTFNLPEEEDKLVFELHQILKRKSQDFMTFNEWFKKYFE